MYLIKKASYIITLWVVIGCFFSSMALSSVDLVHVKKSINTMYLMDGDDIIKEYYVALGANPEGHKEQEGDQKTPEGTYTLDYKKEDSSYYRAMHISYPNEQDMKNAKGKGVSAGGFIMVHGQKNGFELLSLFTQKTNWTDGCIALTNSEMDEFMDLVDVGTKIRIEW